eukprot:gene13087-12866_t
MWGPEDNAIQKLFSTQEIEVLNDQLTELQTKTVELQDEISRTNELVKLDKEARSKLNLLITNLESENAKLKEDLAFFEGFIPGSLQGDLRFKGGLRIDGEVDGNVIADESAQSLLVISETGKVRGSVPKVRDLINEEGNPNLKLRVFVQGGGCSGFQYGFTFDEDVNEDDTALDKGGVTLLIDSMSYQYLTGAEIDYKEDINAFALGGPAVIFTAFVLGWLGLLVSNMGRVDFASGLQTAYRFNSYIGLALASRLGGQSAVANIAILLALGVPLCN